MGLGAAKMARESAKSPDEFERARRRACLFEARSGNQLGAEPMRFVFSIQAAKSNASLRSTRRIENCDAIHPDTWLLVAKLIAQSHGLQRALTPRPIPCLFCDR